LLHLEEAGELGCVAGLIFTCIKVCDQAGDHIRVIFWQFDALFFAFLLDVLVLSIIDTTIRPRFPHFAHSESQALFEEIARGAHYDLVDIEGKCFAGDLQVTVFSRCERSRREISMVLPTFLQIFYPMTWVEQATKL
jgi:hypothetical protein